jgi:hypothetical protein
MDHVSTKETPGPYDALGKAEPGEPMFPLLARDPCAPGAITEWARLRRNLAIKAYGHRAGDKAAKLLDAELRQCANAEAVALEMGDWRKATEAPAELARVNYSGVQRTAGELAEVAKAESILGAVRHLREAAYHASEALDCLRGLDAITPDQAKVLGHSLASINALADAAQPKRGA